MEYQLFPLLYIEVQRDTVSSLHGNLEAWILAMDWVIDSYYKIPILQIAVPKLRDKKESSSLEFSLKEKKSNITNVVKLKTGKKFLNGKVAEIV